MEEVDFAETDLTGAKFEDSDLAGALFEGCNMTKTDFSTAINYTIDPEKNRFNKTKFSKSNLAGLLSNYSLDLIN